MASDGVLPQVSARVSAPALRGWLPALALSLLAACGGAHPEEGHARADAATVTAAAPSGAAAAPSTSPPPATPAVQGLAGELVFQSDRGGRPKIYLLDLSTGTARPLTVGADWRDENPRWAPGGRQILFRSNRAHYEGARPESGTPDYDLYVMEADGSGVRRLTTDAANENEAAWAPDGRSVVFSSDRDSRGDLYRLWLEDSRVERLTRHFVGRALMPTIAPDAARIAFAAQTLRVGEFWDYQVHVLDAGSGRTEAVPSEGGACWPAWSRDGARLAHVLLPRGRPSQLAVRDMRMGQTRTLVADPKLWSYYPDWSGDDRWIAFSQSPEHHEGEDWDLAVLEVATGKVVRLTSGRGNDRLPDWRPR